MRILFCTWAWTTHFYPMVPLAWACRVAGYDVRVASQPALAGTIEGTGLPAVSVGRDVPFAKIFRDDVMPIMDYENDEARSAAELTRVQRTRHEAVLGLHVELAEAMTEDLLEFARSWRPEVVVFDPMTWSAPIAAAKLGLPAVRHLFGPDLPLPLGPEGVDALAQLLTRVGVAMPDLMGDLTIDPCPPALQVGTSVKRKRVRYIPFSGLPAIPLETTEAMGRPRVCVTWGTSTDRLMGRGAFLPTGVIEAVAALGVDTIVAVTAEQATMLPELPGIRVMKSVPLDAVLPGCDAVVQQGGAGTTQTAALCGVPQLALPRVPDQFVNARRIAEAGIGTLLRPDEATPEAVGSHVSRLLDESCGYRSAARALADQMDGQPGLGAAVDAIAGLCPNDEM